VVQIGAHSKRPGPDAEDANIGGGTESPGVSDSGQASDQADGLGETEYRSSPSTSGRHAPKSPSGSAWDSESFGAEPLGSGSAGSDPLGSDWFSGSTSRRDSSAVTSASAPETAAETSAGSGETGETGEASGSAWAADPLSPSGSVFKLKPPEPDELPVRDVAEPASDGAAAAAPALEPETTLAAGAIASAWPLAEPQGSSAESANVPEPLDSTRPMMAATEPAAESEPAAETGPAADDVIGAGAIAGGIAAASLAESPFASNAGAWTSPASADPAQPGSGAATSGAATSGAATSGAVGDESAAAKWSAAALGVSAAGGAGADAWGSGGGSAPKGERRDKSK